MQVFSLKIAKSVLFFKLFFKNICVFKILANSLCININKIFYKICIKSVAFLFKLYNNIDITI